MIAVLSGISVLHFVGGVAAWLQRWLFGPAVPKGGWFAILQHLAMKAVKL